MSFRVLLYKGGTMCVTEMGATSRDVKYKGKKILEKFTRHKE